MSDFRRHRLPAGMHVYTVNLPECKSRLVFDKIEALHVAARALVVAGKRN